MSLPSEGGGNKQVKNASQLSGNINVKQLCFRYPDENVLALKDINFSIKQGEHVAILGKNGCGKSTLNRLLMGFYKAESGQVLLDEIDMLQYEPVLLRQNIGYVPQDVNLFSGTLKENILPAHREVDDESLWEIAKRCGLAKVVNTHGNGFEQQVGEGGKQLSGGQRQSVSLARALIYDPAIFIMDEPTSAMDSANEAMMKETIREAIKGKTFILNTHRTTLLDLVDRVIVIDSGKVIADGRKEDVLPQFKPVPAKQRTAQ